MASNKRTIYLGLDYASFSGGVTEINRKMGLLDAEFKLAQQQAKNYGNETDQTATKLDYLSQKIALQNQKVEEAKKAYDAALASNTASQKEIDSLNKKLITEKTTLEGLNGQLQNTSKETEKATSSSKNMGEVFDKVKEVVIGLASKMKDLAVSFAETGDNLVTLSNITGMTTTEIQELQYAAKFLDVSFETMSDSITRLERNMSNARRGTGDAAEAFKKLHIRITDSRGELRNANEVFDEAIDKLGGVKNETERDALAMQMFGRSAKDLNPLIKAGSDELEKYKQEAHDVGAVMSEETVKGAAETQDAIDKLNFVIDAANNSLAAFFAPVLKEVAGVLSDMDPLCLGLSFAIGGLVVNFAKIAGTMAVFTAATTAQTGAQSALNVVSFKWVGIVLAIGAALAVVVALIGWIIGKKDEVAKTVDASSASLSTAATRITATMNGTDQRTRSVGRNARGTRNWQGGSTWVGEEGPELVNLPRGSRITPASETYNNAVNNYYITIDAKNVSDFNRVVELAKQQQMAIRRT